MKFENRFQIRDERDVDTFSWNEHAGEWLVVRWPQRIQDAVAIEAAREQSTASKEICQLVDEGLVVAAKSQVVPPMVSADSWTEGDGDEIVLRDVVLDPVQSANANELAKLLGVSLDDLMFTFVTDGLRRRGLLG